MFTLSSKGDIESLYHNFSTTLSSCINMFSIEVSYKNRNRITNPWYEIKFKIARREIKEVIEESLKVDKINMYRSLIKRKKRTYINNKRVFYTSLRWILRNLGDKF